MSKIEELNTQLEAELTEAQGPDAVEGVDAQGPSASEEVAE